VKARVALFLALALSTAGCEGLWNAANRRGAEKDAATLLARHGVVVKDLACRMEGTTRAASCTGLLGPGEAEKAAAALGLGLLDDRTLGRGDVGCIGFPWRRGLWGRPASLRLEGGTAFDWFVLGLDPATGKACLAFSYSYG